MKKVSHRFLEDLSGYNNLNFNMERPCIIYQGPYSFPTLKSKHKLVMATTTSSGMFRDEPVMLSLEYAPYTDGIGCAWAVYLVLAEGGYYLWNTFPSFSALERQWNIEYEMRRVLVEKTSYYERTWF